MISQQHLDHLAIKLFRVFSRTEYALKASGFHKGEGSAKANWYTFALEVEELINNPLNSELKEAVDFIFKAPPKKQVIKGGIVTWEDREPDTRSHADKLLQYVRRVRNNLFHGGKFNGNWFAPERSEPLLRHSIVILKAVVEAVPKAKEAYDG